MAQFAGLRKDRRSAPARGKVAPVYRRGASGVGVRSPDDAPALAGASSGSGRWKRTIIPEHNLSPGRPEFVETASCNCKGGPDEAPARAGASSGLRGVGDGELGA